MLHVLLATAVSVSAAIPADSVRPAAKPGPVRVDSTLLALPAPGIKAPEGGAPKISPLVAFWKGGAKVFGLAAMGFAAVAGFFHYVTAGPNEVVPEEEEEAVEYDEAKRRENGGGEARPH